MSNANGVTGLVLKVACGLAVAGILGSIAGYANDGKQDERIATVTETVRQHGKDIRELRDARIATAGHLESIDKSIERITTAIEKIADQ